MTSGPRSDRAGPAGAVAATFTYDPHGNLTAHTGTADTPLRWNGQYQDGDTGLYDLRARYYDPTAQFLTRDPIAALTQNAYGYVGGNALNASDPSGLATVGFCGGANGMAGVAAIAAEGCLTRTVNTVEDQVGLKFVGGVAGGVGANVSAGPYLQVSNAKQLSDLAGPFLFATVGAEYLAGASVTYFWSPDGKFWGVSAGPSFGAGADLAAGVSWTNVVQLHGLSAALARIAWDASSNPVLNIADILSNAKTAIDQLNSSICD